MSIILPLPELQIEFSFALGQARALVLQDALCKTLGEVDIRQVDRELAQFVNDKSLRQLAQHGLRGEMLYPVPCLLEANPYLIAYYRLALGYSQKEFYTTKLGVSGFKSMETRGIISKAKKEEISQLCEAFALACDALVDGIGADRISKRLLDDLSLLTLGAQFRGGANVTRGANAIVDVFQAIHDCVEHAATNSAPNRIEIINAAGRKVLIEFAADPDIVIREEMGPKRYRNIIAIEVKGGQDFSNIHNRIGEAEKSHKKAKDLGYVECWTVVNVDKMNFAIASTESPSTNQFYRLSDLNSRTGDAYRDFRERIISLTGIRAPSA